MAQSAERTKRNASPEAQIQQKAAAKPSRLPVSPLAMRSPLVQPKLVVNEPGDRYEQEANQIAEVATDPGVTGQDKFNPGSIVNVLRRAIDQSDHTFGFEKLDHNDYEAIGKELGYEEYGEAIGSVLNHVGVRKEKSHRKVNFDAVYEALNHLSLTQINIVRNLYAEKEKSTLDNDLFGLGQSGYRSSLTVNQRSRLQVLLRGTKGNALGPEIRWPLSNLTVNELSHLQVLLRGMKGSALGPKIRGYLKEFRTAIAMDLRLQRLLTETTLPVVRLNQLERTALEIVPILSGTLDSIKLERLMALHRRPVEEISIIDLFYERHTGMSLPRKICDKLEGLQHSRMEELRKGNTALADAFAIEAQRRAIEALDRAREDNQVLEPILAIFDPGVVSLTIKGRQALVDEIDKIVAWNQQEAIATNATMTASDAVAQRMKDVLSQTVGQSWWSDGHNVGDLLKATLGQKKAAVLTAITNGSLIEAHARRLAETESRGKTKSKQIVTALRELRDEATHDVIARIWDPQVSQQEKQMILEKFDEAVKLRASEYVTQFQAKYEEIRRGEFFWLEGRPWAEIVASFKSTDEDEVNRMDRGAGTMTDAEELDLAIRRKKPELVIVILKRQPTQEAVRRLRMKYLWLTGKWLVGSLYGYHLYGQGGAATAEEAAFNYLPFPHGVAGGVMSGRYAVLAEEQLTKPAKKDRRGIAEMVWIAASADQEFEATWENRGLIGYFRDWGDDPETQKIMQESIGEVWLLSMRWLRSDDKGERRRILAKMKQWRATLTGDAAAYEADNEQMVSQIRSVVSIAVQLALAVALPGAGATLAGFARGMAIDIAASIASNVVIYGDDYSLDRLRSDIVGGVLGAAGSKFGEELAGVALAKKEAGALADQIAEGIAKPVADATAVAAAKVGISTTIAKEAASQLGSTTGQSLATGENQFTLENLLQSVLMSGASRLGKRPIEHDTATVPGGRQPVSSTAETTIVTKPVVSESVAATTNAPAPKPRKVNKHVVRRSAPTTKTQHAQQPTGSKSPVAETLQQTTKAVQEADSSIGPKTPSKEKAQEHTQVEGAHTQVTGAPTGMVLQAADPHHLVEAFKLYRQGIGADPTREVALLYNHKLDQWAVVQGGPRSVPTNAGMRLLGWEVVDTVLARHSHPVGPRGLTSEANVFPSGRGGDIQIVRQDAPKGNPSAAAHMSVIDVMTAHGPDRTFLFYDRKIDMWIVDYPAVGERGGRARVSFVTMNQYNKWFKGRFGFSPNISVNAASPRSPEHARARERLDEHLNHMIENDINPQIHLGYSEEAWEKFKLNYENNPSRAFVDLENRLDRAGVRAEKTKSRTQATEELEPTGPQLSVSSKTSLARAIEAGIPSELIGDGTVMTRADFSEIMPDSPPITGRIAPKQINPIMAVDQMGRPIQSRPVSRSKLQNVDVLHDYDLLVSAGANPGSIRVNQMQVIEDMRIGRNRPDLYAELNGQRIFIEYDRAPGTRAIPHARRILTNDPKAIVILKIIDFD